MAVSAQHPKVTGTAASSGKSLQEREHPAARALKLYAERLNEGNISQAAGAAEALLRRSVRMRELPRDFVFRQFQDHYPKNRKQKRRERDEALNFPLSEEAKFRMLAELSAKAGNGQTPATTTKALALAGAVGYRLATAAEAGERVQGRTPQHWVGAIRQVFQALASKVSEALGPAGG
jgi:hypothetical protein